MLNLLNRILTALRPYFPGGDESPRSIKDIPLMEIEDQIEDSLLDQFIHMCAIHEEIFGCKMDRLYLDQIGIVELKKKAVDFFGYTCANNFSEENDLLAIMNGVKIYRKRS